MLNHFSSSQLEAIADALGHTSEGLTGSEIAYLLSACSIDDRGAGLTKRIRLYNAFAHSQNQRRDRKGVLAFIRKAMKPERYLRESHRFEPLRQNLNKALAFAGLAVDEAGNLGIAEQARTIPEAERKAQELRGDLTARGVHPDVLKFCRAELVADNYFHAVLEATKSIADKIRVKTGLSEDGATLIDHALGGSSPILAINHLSSESQWSEQRGLMNLVKGVFGMFRNPTAHEARTLWVMTKDDAEDLLSLASLIHRRLDTAVVRERVAECF